MNPVNRRDFMRNTAGAAAAGTLGFNIKKYSGSPADTVRVAVVGLRGQGKSHTSSYLKMPNVEIAALCDIDDAQFDGHLKSIDSAGKPKPKIYKDVRKLLEDKSIDAISIATPNHWHALITIWGLQAGKDVYCEKPMSHSYWEGRQVVAAAQKYGLFLCVQDLTCVGQREIILP